MSSKKAHSVMPSELNENWGSNYGLDGFWHDMDYGKGNEDSIGSDPIPQPSTSGLSHLPDGLMLGTCGECLHESPEAVERETEGAMDLGGIEIVAAFDPTSDPSAAGVIDHTWLTDAFQDPDRLPDNPVDDGISELSNAWGDRTDGLFRLDLFDRSSVQPNLGERPTDDDILHREKLASVLRSAMRRSAAGVPFKTIFREVHVAVGTEGVHRLASSLRAIQEEHGLTGNVYVRASAYPGLHQGKWSAELRRAAKTARYLIASQAENLGGCAEGFGLTVVADPSKINWKNAFAQYAPQLEASGRLNRSATTSNERNTLRHAFLSQGKTTSPEIMRESVAMPVDKVTVAEARKALANAPATVRETIVYDRDEKIAQKKLTTRLGAMVQARLLSREEAQILSTSTAPPNLRMKMAEYLAARTTSGTYRGAVQRDPQVHISDAEFQAATPVRDKTASTQETQQRRQILSQFSRLETVRQAALGKVQKIATLVDKGLSKVALHAAVTKAFTATERRLVASELDPVLVRGHYYEQTPSSEYSGPVLREAQAESRVETVSPKEISSAIRWARQQMNEGVLGKGLTELLSIRLSPPLLKAASEQLVQIRKRHEGLAGQIYVEAAAYASPTGTKGCDEGALQHRTNGIRYVLSMERCNACVFKNANDVCQKYNKPLLDSLEDGVAQRYQREALAAARRTDQEETASLFSRPGTVKDPVSEFGLHNAALDDVTTADLEHASLDGIFFGDLET